MVNRPEGTALRVGGLGLGLGPPLTLPRVLTHNPLWLRRSHRLHLPAQLLGIGRRRTNPRKATKGETSWVLGRKRGHLGRPAAL